MNQHVLPEGWSGLPREVRDIVLKKLLARRREQAAATAVRLNKADRTAALPASLEQSFFLRQHERSGGRVAWTIAAPPVILEKVDAEKVRNAVTTLARRHDVLHATFEKSGDRFLLRLDPDTPPPFSATKAPLTAALTGVEAWVRRRYEGLLAQPFDPEKGPLWRAELCTLAGRGVLLLTFCSAIVDGESLYLIDRDLRALLADQSLPVREFDYADYASTQNGLDRAGRFEALLAWWRRRLAGGPPAAWDHGRPAAAPAPLYEQVLGPETGQALDAFAASKRTTPHVVLLTELMSLLRRIDGDDDLWVASATATRDIPGTEEMVGTFARQALLRFAWPAEGNPLPGVHAMLAETLEQPPLPHLLVREMLERDYPQTPSAYRYIFNHRHVGPAAGEKEEDADVLFRAGPAHATADREEDVLLLVMQSGHRLRLHWYLRSDRFNAEEAERLLSRFDTSLRRSLLT